LESHATSYQAVIASRFWICFWPPRGTLTYLKGYRLTPYIAEAAI